MFEKIGTFVGIIFGTYLLICLIVWFLRSGLLLNIFFLFFIFGFFVSLGIGFIRFLYKSFMQEQVPENNLWTLVIGFILGGWAFEKCKETYPYLDYLMQFDGESTRFWLITW